LAGLPGDFLHGLDEVVSPETNEVGCSRFVDLGGGEGGVEPEVQKGSLSAFEEIGEAFLGEGAAGFWVLPHPTPKRGIRIIYNQLFSVSHLSVMAS
jgi:hypothetical protein